MTRQDFVSLWEFAQYLELTEKGSKLYEDVKAALKEHIINEANKLRKII